MFLTGNSLQDQLYLPNPDRASLVLFVVTLLDFCSFWLGFSFQLPKTVSAKSLK